VCKKPNIKQKISHSWQNTGNIFGLSSKLLSQVDNDVGIAEWYCNNYSYYTKVLQKDRVDPFKKNIVKMSNPKTQNRRLNKFLTSAEKGVQWSAYLSSTSKDLV